MFRDRSLLNAYRNHLVASGRSLGTVQQRILHVEHLQRRLPDLLAATLEDLEAHMAAKRVTNGPEGQKAIRASLRAFYAWATETGRIDRDPAYPLKPIRIPQVIARVALDHDVADGLDRATLQERAMVLLARYGGLRLNEVTTLRTEHRHGDLLHVNGKGGKHRIVPAHPELLSVLVALERLQGDGPYFPGRYGGSVHKSTVYKVIVSLTGWNPHALRHAAATAAYEATGDLKAVQEFLGHSSLATTQRYLHTSLKSIRRVADGTTLRAA